jgi:RNA polymerase sigma-70 factor (family 1)
MNRQRPQGKGSISNFATPEQQLISEFQRGKSWAFEQIFHRYYGRICYFITKLVSDHEIAKDIASDVFLKVYEKKRQFKTEENIKAFLYVASRNQALNHLNRNKITEKVHKNIAHALSGEPSESKVLCAIMDAEVLRQLNQAIEALPKQCRRVSKLSLDGLNTGQIAVALNLSPQTVRNTKARALKILKSKFAYNTVAIAYIVALVDQSA